MKVRGDNSPGSAFTLEALPNKPGFVLARFYENAQQFTEQRDEGEPIHGWVYDEYHLELEDRPGLEEDVRANFDAILAQAKAQETPEEPGDLAERVQQLEDDKASRAEVKAVWDQMAAAYQEGVQSA